jgi:DNA repair protein SbcC/Rad50
VRLYQKNHTKKKEMIPEKLTIQGLYSYRQRQVIDFSSLTSAGLFGLFGGVGSGKSTILEAISFALYGESERLNRGDNRNYNMMNLKMGELLIDFEFKTGIDERYRFAVAGKRNSKNYDDVKTFTRSAYKWFDGQWTPLETTNAEGVTGLSYDNFRRTIIIPQGKFQEFLQLGAKERTAMLMELFNLERFDLASKVASMELRNNEQMIGLNGQLSSLVDLSLQNPDELKNTIVEKEAEVKGLTKLAGDCQEEIKAQEQAKLLQEKMLAQKDRLDGLQTLEPEIKRLDAELTEFTQLVMAFKGDFEQLDNITQKRSELEKQLLADNQHLEVGQKQLIEVEAEFKKAKADFDSKDQLLKQADEYDKLARVAQLNINKKEQQVRLEKGKQLLDEKNSWLTAAKKQRDEQKVQHDKLKKEMPDQQRLMAIKTWFVQQKSISDAHADMIKRIEANEKSRAELEKMAVETVSKLDCFWHGVTDLTQVLQMLDNEMLGIQTRKEQLQQSRTQHEVSRQLRSFAEVLTEGDPCPLCGSHNHPHLYNAGDADELLAAIDSDMKVLDVRRKQVEQVAMQVTQAVSKVQLLTSQVNDDKNKCVIQDQKLAEHLSQFVWSDYSLTDYQKVEDNLSLSQKTAHAIDQLASAIELSSKNIEKAEADREKYAKVLEQIERDLLAIASENSTLMAQITLVDKAQAHSQQVDALAQTANKFRQQHQAVVLHYNQCDNSMQKMLQAINQLKGNIDARSKTQAEIAADYERLVSQIHAKRSLMGDVSMEHIARVIGKNINSQDVRRQIDKWNSDCAAAKELYTALMAELNGRVYDPVSHQAGVDQYQQVTLKIKEATTILNQTNLVLKQLVENLEKQKTLNARLDQLKLRAANLTLLKNLFRSSGFVNYVSTVYLQNLCAAANSRFYKLTRQHLSLELADDNTFVVRDFMNEGKTRSVKTLSGGQTFQASLSLALALADSVRHLSAGHENFFFLDEGFGTLDRESLGTVFDTLKSLRHENRIVGVISHVDEMQQEIQTYLRITNSEEKGSVVQGSWERVL